ncbi:MAG: class A beta-lactamase-related serine hydrolase [Ferruginibacter sp.]|nr:class A beta-lactamase-related serine hydrolase [Ferruginibacter sp.]
MKKIAFLSLSILIISSANAQTTADSLLNFIQANKSRASLFLSVNDTVVGRLNENTMMPLASTVKILVAIEFAKQAANNIFDKDEMVPLKELDKYYLPDTDGDAHPGWIDYEKGLGHIIDDSVSLLNIARGMILFSSNANTEYLMDLVGLDNIKNNNEILGIKNHTVVYPLVASLFMYQNPKKKTEDYILKGISTLTEEQYCRFIYDMHKALKYDTVLKSKFKLQDLTMKMQKAWSDRLPSSTTKDYVQVCRVLNNRKYFDSSTYVILSKVLEAAMENPINKQWLQHFGEKGGSTAFILTKALYATTKKGIKIEMAYFFNGLTEAENEKLQGWMNAFEISTLTSKVFRNKITAALN